MMDPGIICFQHCGPRVFCFSLPDSCPVCKEALNNANFSLLPFRVPYPFVQASQYSCAVVIKPTAGDFLNDYLNSKDLHVGVTTSKGAIVEFDRNGLRHHPSPQWGQCLLVDRAPGPWRDHWDATLRSICDQDCWTSDAYRENSHNCYSFVLNFLVDLGYGSLSRAASNKTLFCEEFIIPRTKSAGKYISLYRKLKKCGVYVDESSN